MIRTYIVEKDTKLPLCLVEHGKYINFMTGELLDNKVFLDLVKNNLENGIFKKRKLDFKIYAIYSNTHNFELIGYNYEIDDTINLLDHKKRAFGESNNRFVMEELSKGNYFERVIWE